MTVAIGPVEIAGIARGLEDGLTKLGVPVTLAMREPHAFDYRGGRSSLRFRWLQVAQRRWIANKSRPWRQKLPHAVAARVTAWSVFLSLVPRHETFIYLFGQTYTGSVLELRILRLLCRKVVFFYCGSDLRPRFMDGPAINEFDDNGESVASFVDRLEAQRARITRQERFATLCVAHPSQAHFLTQPFVSLAALGLPASTPIESAPTEVRRADGEILALHAPSDQRVKGTDGVIAMVDRLRSEGVPIQLEILSGVTHGQVLEALDRCDLVIDQRFCDVPLGALGVEAAQRSVPTVLSGYYAAHIDAVTPSWATAPSIYVTPDELESAVRELVTDPVRRRAVAEASRQFVQSTWSPETVAERLMRAARGDIDADLWLQPEEVSYTLGCGVDAERCRRMIRDIIMYGGVSALQIDDKPLALASLGAAT